MHPIRRLAAVSTAAVVTASLVACTSSPRNDETLELRIGVEPRYVEQSPVPYLSDLYSLGWAPVYETLVSWDPEIEAYGPWLAKEMELSEDRRTLDFVLHDDIDFTDGAHLTAHAVAEYFAAVAEIQDQPVFAEWNLEIEVTGEYELRFGTSKPMTDRFMRALGNTAIASPEVVSDPGAFDDGARGGTGPYVLDEWIPEVSMSFVRNPDYWNPGVYDFDTVTITSFPDKIAALNALKSGQINVASLDPSLAAEAEGAGFSLAIGNGSFAVLIINDMHGDVIPALGDKRVRQAMNLVFDREAIVESVDSGYGRASSQIGTTGQPHYVEGGDDYYGFDIPRARELMAEAGFEDGFDLVIPTLAGFAAIPPGYQAIVQQGLSEINIRVSYEAVLDIGTLFGGFADDTYQVMLVKPAYQDLPLTVMPILGDDADRDPVFHEYAEIAENGTAAESVEAQSRLGEYLLEEGWFVVLSHPSDVWAMTPDISFTPGTQTSAPQLHLFTHDG